MDDEKMGNFVGDHFFQRLLHRFDNQLPVFGVKNVEECTGDKKTLL